MTKKLIHTLLILVAFHINAFAQTPKSYTLTHIVNKTIDKGEYVDDKRIDKKDKISTGNLIYISSPKNDSIAFYEFNDSPVSEKKVPNICALAKNQNSLLLTYKNESYSTKLKITFNNNEKTVLIGDKDVFYLNDSYYKYIQKSIGDNLNIPDLIDFLEDFLAGYALEDLKYKSMKYLESDSYKKLLEFINSNNYQVFIFGHSCGISDRTLLNTLFEHKNCNSIKPYYRQKDNGSDNYSEMIRNISRNFTDKASMRDKVVNKKYTNALFR
ncbi:hypothetical protein J2787_001571 [Chryseobacterium rhizosphaerae]|uniref:OmpA-like domain-containing protein n=1 Tax=Chryseobacterium rhizosphaerae TaxID=395937 RepID=A0AAE4C185_9FLAO|nr:hypothetical protein [Chryseobacterium rhizosphaerae]MDR6526201.1 hypothetical protein [Chryseobacterium rhizosphaerae]